jgi:hypothetical protein
MFKFLINKPPLGYNIRKIINYNYIYMETDLFMTFDKFKEQLGSWAKPL